MILKKKKNRRRIKKKKKKDKPEKSEKSEKREKSAEKDKEKIKHNKETKDIKRPSSSVEDNESSAKKKQKAEQPEEDPGFGFEHGDEVDEILGADKREPYGLYFYVAWKNKDGEESPSKGSKDTRRKSFVMASKCNHKCPQKVIKFYESRLTFESSK